MLAIRPVFSLLFSVVVYCHFIMLADKFYIIQAGRRLDSALIANVVAMATKIGPWSSPLVGPNISDLSDIQADL